MVKSRLAEPDAQKHGWLLDGYPRSAEQAEAIEAVNIRPDLFILINVRMPAPTLHPAQCMGVPICILATANEKWTTP